jgi:hypothetical protein
MSLARFGRRLTGFSYAGAGRAYEVRAVDTDAGYCGSTLPRRPLRAGWCSPTR